MTGRIALLYLDRGNGWECLTPHEADQAALESLSIDWGVARIDEQPDAPVLRFTVRDRSGDLAGDVLYLAGARVWLQKTDAVPWRRFDVPGQWRQVDQMVSWDELEDLDPPAIPATPDTSLETVFYGRVTVGGTVTQRDKGDWLVSLYASGMSVLTHRQAQQGPYLGLPQLDGYHWPYDPAQRLDVLQQRLADSRDMPVFDDLDTMRALLPPSVAPYAGDSFPDTITIIRNLVSSSPSWPLVYEAYVTGRSNPAVFTPVLCGGYARIAMLADGSVAVSYRGHVSGTIPADQVMVDATELGLPDPVTRVVVKGKKATWDDGKQRFGFEDTELSYSDQGLVPDNLAESQKSVSVDTDAILKDDTGRWNPGVFAPSDGQRQQVAAVILANSTRLIPQQLKTDSRKTDDTEHAGMFHAYPGHPLVFIHNRYTPLTDRDGTPATGGAWLPIGGTLTYRHRGREATWSNELQIYPLPRDPTTQPLQWRDLEPVACKWQRLPAFTWSEFAQIDMITTDMKELKA